MEVANNLTYCNMAAFTAVRSFIVQAVGASTIKHYKSVMYGLRSTLVCLLAGANMFVQARRH
jgi:hypothetical protein